MSEQLMRPATSREEEEFERSLRPKHLGEFVGQKRNVDNLKVFIEAARERGEALDHVIFSGPPGLGKTTLAFIVASELEVEISVSSGPAIERPADIAGLLTSQQTRDVVFLDEIHRVPKPVEEYLYTAMEDLSIDIVVDKGAGARTVRLSLEPFTLVGATTRMGLLSSPLLGRFGISMHLDYYTTDELATIVKRSAGVLGVKAEPQGVKEIAGRSRGTPRVANRLLKRVRDFAQVQGDGVVTGDIARHALDMLEVDRLGLGEMDRRILRVLTEKFRGRPVGLKTLATAVGEEPDTLEEVYEPFLIRAGLLERTSQGRVASPRAWEHLGAGQGLY